MTLGLAFLLLFLPVIGVFIASNFDVVAGYIQSAIGIFESVPDVSNTLWGLLPGSITSFIVGLFIISLSVGLLLKIVGGR